MGAESLGGSGWPRGRSGWAALAATTTTKSQGKATKATHDKWRRLRRRLRSYETMCGCEWVSNCFWPKAKTLSCENSNKNNTKKEQRQKQEAATKTSATLLHFWRALQFKIAVSQSVMKWNTPATSYKKSTKKLQKNATTKNNTKYNTTAHRFQFVHTNLSLVRDALEFRPKPKLFVFCFVAKVQNKCSRRAKNDSNNKAHTRKIQKNKIRTAAINISKFNL